MSGGLKKVNKNEYLFREGDPSDAMYVIKSGRISITKIKGNGEIILAEKKGGEMLGEMGFFDNKPRSAGAKAMQDTEVIALPFTSLHAQFKTFPEWLKAMVRTVNSQLREANSRIKNLEAISKDVEEVLAPHMVTKLCAVIVLVGLKNGEPQPEGTVIPFGMLRDYTIQVFQQPTNKLDRLFEALQSVGQAKYEDLGEGKKRVVITNLKLLEKFTDYYNKYLYTSEDKRVSIEDRELNPLRVLRHYGRRGTPDAKGLVQVNLTEVQAHSGQDLKIPFNGTDADSLVQKNLVEEKRSEADNTLSMKIRLEEIEQLLPFWEIIHTVRKLERR